MNVFDSLNLNFVRKNLRFRTELITIYTSTKMAADEICHSCLVIITNLPNMYIVFSFKSHIKVVFFKFCVSITLERTRFLLIEIYFDAILDFVAIFDISTHSLSKSQFCSKF